MKRITLLLSAVSFTACTAVNYTSPSFPEVALDHQEVAVLPVEMVFTGKAPKGLAAEDILLIEEGESLAFQASLYNYLLNRSSPHRRRPVWISIQPIETTNQLLREEGLAIRDTWALPADELAEVLEVDAVVRTRVRKTRYLSDLASFGIAVGVHVVLEALDEDHAWLLPWGPRTYDIYAEGQLVTADEGTLLWKVAVNRETDWSQPANDVVRGITRKLAKKFPYRGDIASG
ncbi:MAG: hypothetical protein GY769_03520 [bacterium]|nr:hypothetical protein [bacterium]